MLAALETHPAALAEKPSLVGLTRAELSDALGLAGVPERERRMRASQLWRWIYHYGVTDFAAMTNMSKEMRAALAAAFTLARPEIVEQVSNDGTRKWLIRLPATAASRSRPSTSPTSAAGALCVSSQVGCTLNCTFCHTGTQALVRNLTAAEIVAQVQVARDDRRWPEWPLAEGRGRRPALTNIVFMGMGEPLYNLDNVADAIDIIADGEGIAISRRRITVSTSGVVPKIQELGERTRAMLAISLHATNDELRDELVPLNKKYTLEELIAAIRAYPGLSNAKRVTFEYVMLKGVNDSAGRGARPWSSC